MVDVMKIDLNKIYTSFDDGKIKPSRMFKVKLTKVVPFKEAPTSAVLAWREEVVNCPWLYAKTTDYFLLGLLCTGGKDVEEVAYVRTKDGRWFGLGDWGGRLDLDGSLEIAMNEYLAKEK